MTNIAFAERELTSLVNESHAINWLPNTGSKDIVRKGAYRWVRVINYTPKGRFAVTLKYMHGGEWRVEIAPCRESGKVYSLEEVEFTSYPSFEDAAVEFLEIIES